MSKKKPARPASKTAKTARKPERSKGELSSDDLDSVAGGVANFATNLPGGEDQLPMESISLNYSKMVVTYKEMDKGGDQTSGVPGGYPLAKKK